MNAFKARAVFVSVVLAMGTFHAHARGPGGAASPEVERIEIDTPQQNLFLKGKFFKVNEMVISIGHHQLEVIESSQTRVVAKLPPNLPPATYRVLVSTSNTHAKAASLYFQVPQKQASLKVATGGE